MVCFSKFSRMLLDSMMNKTLQQRLGAGQWTVAYYQTFKLLCTGIMSEFIFCVNLMWQQWSVGVFASGQGSAVQAAGAESQRNPAEDLQRDDWLARAGDTRQTESASSLTVLHILCVCLCSNMLQLSSVCLVCSLPPSPPLPICPPHSFSVFPFICLFVVLSLFWSLFIPLHV